jgi:hypothetical protein
MLKMKNKVKTAKSNYAERVAHYVREKCITQSCTEKLSVAQSVV